MALMCILVGTAQGAVYYVDNMSPLCDDSPSHGSEAAPWRTLSYGIGRLSGGDTLYVKSGNYHESGLYLSGGLSGTAVLPTIIAAYPGDSATISGGGTNTGRVKITGCVHLKFAGFIVRNFNQGIYVEASTNITVQDCTVQDIGQEGMHVNGNSLDVTIQNCTIHDTGKWIYNGEGIYVGTGSAGPVDNTAFVTIRSNTIFHTGIALAGGEAIELKPGTHDCVVEHNLVYDIHTASWVGAIEVNEALLGVQHWDANPNHVIRDNVVHNTETAIRLGTGCLAFNNLVYDVTNGSYGILLDNNAGDAHPRLVYHNTVDAPAAGAVFVQTGQPVVSDIRNNIGPALTNNMSAEASYFVNPAAGDYHLMAGSSPVDAGMDLSGIVPADLDGIPRPAGTAPDLGAYEFVKHAPLPPTDLRVVR